ncbi:TAP-like protein [Pseudoduganella lurida]|uniref:TAP-like protein n=1 Tax=Pseudoduganella lurida TaxID=1036180 RepID=A0A562REZ1_9BURK|nr:alpha/beta hydrolase [Pseudoduganella lurida]TWI67473.1 TAP-like protein [Pseudoduganella lurida]
MSRWLSAWFGCAWFLAAAACAAPRAGDVMIEQGAVTADDGSVIPYEIGTILVPENRAVAGSRLIGVGFARIRARVPTDAPPVFWLPGGPGLAVLDAPDGTDSAARGRLKSWLTYGAVADLVIVEQRGYTLRGERLEVAAPALPLDRPRTAGADAAAAIALARLAVAAHPGKDLAGYTIRACADDVDDVRRALGYERIALFGSSFGSQWSLAVMRAHPRIVARAVLSAVEPLDYGYDMPSPLLATLRRIAADADRDPSLRPFLPTGGLMAAAAAVRDRLASAPVTVRVHGREVVLGVEDFRADLLDRAAAPEAWPAFVLALYQGRYEAWAGAVLHDRAAQPVKLIGPLIDTSLGITPGRLRQLRSDPAAAWTGTGGFEPYLAAADAWPTPDMGDDFRTMTPSPIPVLLVHGDWDTSTPVDNALAQLPYFPNGHAIVVHRGGHDGPFYLLREAPAVKEAVYRFLRTGSMAGLPTEITLPPPRFALP